MSNIQLRRTTRTSCVRLKCRHTGFVLVKEQMATIYEYVLYLGRLDTLRNLSINDLFLYTILVKWLFSEQLPTHSETIIPWSDAFVKTTYTVRSRQIFTICSTFVLYIKYSKSFNSFQWIPWNFDTIKDRLV